MAFLDPTHPDAFLDLSKKEPYLPWNLTLECPTCKGHGQWNLVINEYMRYENPADRHFKQMCGTCNGHGYVNPARPVCEHDWSHRVTIGKCLHRVTCIKCNQTVEIDSGD